MTEGAEVSNTQAQKHGVPRSIIAISGVAAVLFFLYIVSLSAVERAENSPELLWDVALYAAWMVLGIVIVGWRARQSTVLKRGWALVAAYLALTLIAELAFRFTAEFMSGPGITIADVFYLASYVCIGAGLIILSRRDHSVSPLARIDGLIVGLTTGAVIFAAYLPASWHGGQLDVVGIDLIYPVLDIVFATIVVSGLVPLRLRPTPATASLLLAVLVIAWGDFVYVEQATLGQYEQGTVLEASWAAGSALIIAAALLPNPYKYQPGIHRRWSIFTPSLASFVALAIIGWSLFRGTPSISVALALGALTLASVRLVLTMLDLRRMGEGYEQARRDYLTDLTNRRGLTELVESWLGTVEEGGNSARNPAGGLLLVGVTGVKPVTDALGHTVGDDLIRAIGVRLKAATQPFTLARLDGSDFATLVTDGDQLDPVAQAVLAAMDSPVAVGSLSIRVRVTVGIALVGGANDSPDALLRAADVALTQAHERGLGIVEYDANDDPTTQERVDLMAELHSGLDRGELFMLYQPLVRVSDGRVLGAEALVRWRHPKLGVLQPGDFVIAAERSGLIGRVTRQALTLSCQALQGWLRDGLDLTISVNVSGIDLVDDSLSSTVSEVLAETGVEAGRLVVEITETAMGADPDQTWHTVAELRDKGVQIAIDDFGVGYSSLAQLLDLPVDELKVDRRFMAAANSERRTASLNAAIRLASALDATVVVEGVETEADLDLLRRLNCDVAQGYLFTRPLPADEFGHFAARARR